MFELTRSYVGEQKEGPVFMYNTRLPLFLSSSNLGLVEVKLVFKILSL